MRMETLGILGQFKKGQLDSLLHGLMGSLALLPITFVQGLKEPVLEEGEGKLIRNQRADQADEPVCASSSSSGQ